MTQKTINVDNYKKVGNISVDMCVACIQHNLKHQKPLVSIVLSSAYYNIFRKWVIDNWGEEYSDSEWFISGINIRKEIIISGKSLIEEYYKPEKLN